MGGSADPDAPTPSPSPSPAKASPSPSSADAKRLRRCVQSKLSWGTAKSGGGGGGVGGGGGGGGAGAAPPVPAAEEPAEKEGREEPEKGEKRGRLRKSEAGRKPYSNKETSGLDPGSKDEIILVDESPQKKQRKGKKQNAALKVPNRKRCKALESTDGHGSCQQLNSSQTVLPEASTVSIDIDLMSVPSEARQANDNVDALDNQDKSQLIVDLRSEAKITAELFKCHLIITRNMNE